MTDKPRKRLIALTVIVEVNDYSDTEELSRFFWEENHCHSNEIHQLADEQEAAGQNICIICHRARAKLLPAAMTMGEASDWLMSIGEGRSP
jgi:hypothetical protein